MSPQEKLLKNEPLIKLMLEHHYVPHASQGHFAEVVEALREINPNAIYNTGCAGCFGDIARTANAHLQMYKDSIKMTFPEHKKKV